MSRRNLYTGLAWIGLTIAGWMPMYSVAKRALEHIDAFAIGTLRYLFGTLLLVALLAAAEGWRALRFEGRLASATILGLIGITGFNVFAWVGLMHTRPEHAALIVQMQSPLSALGLWLVRGQRPAAFTLACVGLAIAGVLIVVTRGAPFEALAGTGREVLLGDALVLLGALSWVVYALALSVFSGWSALRMTVLTCIPGAAGLAIAEAIAIAAGVAVLPGAGDLLAVGWQIAYFAIGSVLAGMLGFNVAARQLGPLNALLMLNIIPVGVFVIEAALGRSFSPFELAGAALVVGALVANNLYLRGASTSR